MANLIVAPGYDLDLESLFPSNALNLTSVLSGLLSQTNTLNGAGIGQVVSTFSELVSEVAGGGTIRYVGEFVSSVDQGLLGSSSGITGNISQVILEQAGDIVAVLNLDDALGVDFGELTSIGLLGLDLNAITGGLLGDLLGNLLGNVGGILDVLDEPVDAVLETVTTLLEDLTGQTNTGGTPTNDDDILLGSNKGDAISGLGGDDLVYGRGGNDVLHGNDGDDKLYGGSGKDKLYGDVGVDLLVGGAGKDWLYGGDGDDRLIGGRGRDILVGGAGADDFVFLGAKDSRGKGVDMIRDFNKAQGDEIDLSGFGDLDFIGKKQFSGDDNEIRIAHRGGDTFIQGDLNGDNKVDFTIRLDGKIILTADDFIL
ncbi:calcium-binding protein [Rhizobium sp.]